jgi:hypothetical protein
MRTKTAYTSSTREEGETMTDILFWLVMGWGLKVSIDIARKGL